MIAWALAALLAAPAAAWQLKVDFETAPSTHVYLYSNSRIIDSLAAPGGSRVLECGLPEGVQETYCGFGVNFGNHSLENMYIRYYVKFSTSWLFSESNPYFKSQIVEVNVSSYVAGGRAFVNFNTVARPDGTFDPTIADIAFLSYSSGSWLSTGRTISNDARWRAIETHIQRNLLNPPNGRLRMWIDGELVINVFPYNAGNVLPRSLTYGYRNGPTQRPMTMQYDEFVVSDQPIGLVSPTPTDRTPARPRGLRAG